MTAATATTLGTSLFRAQRGRLDDYRTCTANAAARSSLGPGGCPRTPTQGDDRLGSPAGSGAENGYMQRFGKSSREPPGPGWLWAPVNPKNENELKAWAERMKRGKCFADCRSPAGELACSMRLWCPAVSRFVRAQSEIGQLTTTTAVVAAASGSPDAQLCPMIGHARYATPERLQPTRVCRGRYPE